MLPERDLLRLLLDVNNLMLARLDLRGFLTGLSAAIQPAVAHDRLSIAFLDPDAEALWMPMSYVRGRGVVRVNASIAVDRSPQGVTLRLGFSRVFVPRDLRELDLRRQPAGTPAAMCCVPLPTRDGPIGVLSVAGTRAGAFSRDRVELLVQASTSIAAVAAGVTSRRAQVRAAPEHLSRDPERRTPSAPRAHV